MVIAASNQFGVKNSSGYFDYSNRYVPTQKHAAGFGLMVDGFYIGRVRDFTPPSFQRTITPQKELNPFTWGQPVDAIPGGVDGFEMQVVRADLWGAEIEVAFGETDPYILLSDQRRPFIIDEVMFRGTTVYSQFRYLGCWFSNMSREGFSSDGDGVLTVSASLSFVTRIRVK